MTQILGYCALALGLGAFFGCILWAAKSLIPHESVTDNAGAVEGNDRFPRVRAIDDDPFWDDI